MRRAAAVAALLCVLLCGCARQEGTACSEAAGGVVRLCVELGFRLPQWIPEAEDADGEPAEAEEVDSEFLEVFLASADRHYNMIGYYHPIEKAYMEESATLHGATFEMISFYQKYRDLWMEEGDNYEALIEESLAEDAAALTAFQTAQQGWEDQMLWEMSAYSAITESAYAGGSIVGPRLELHRMGLYRARAIELIQLYLNIQYDQLKHPQIEWMVR